MIEQVKWPNAVVSLRQVADMLEAYWSVAPEFRHLFLRHVGQNLKDDVVTFDGIRQEYKRTGDKIQAIKEVRAITLNPLDNTCMGLKEAKDLVESW